jgi:hypothetical protein
MSEYKQYYLFVEVRVADAAEDVTKLEGMEFDSRKAICEFLEVGADDIWITPVSDFCDEYNLENIPRQGYHWATRVWILRG